MKVFRSVSDLPLMRILVITHTFPPSLHSNAKRPFYLVKALLNAGWEVDVATSFIGTAKGMQETLVDPNCRIFRTDDPVWRLQRALVGHPKLAKVVGLAANGLLFPDFCALWTRSLFRKFRKTFDDYDRVLAFVFPPSVLLSGSYDVVDCNWIFDFQESVTPQFEKFPRKSLLQRSLTARLRNLETHTLHQAGRVVFTANSNRKAYLNAGLVCEEITEHVPYFYDEDAFRQPGDVGKLFEIGYYGNFDFSGSRNPSTFLAALAGFLKRHPEAREQTRFTFHGAWLDTHNRLLDELNLRDVCRIEKAVPYQEYLERLKQSPILLLVVAEAHNLFMPSKIVDYFGARRPILAFVPPKSEMHEVLVEAGMEEYLCGDRDVEQGIQALENLWNSYLSGSLQVDSSRTSKWSSSYQLSRYLRLLETPAGDQTDTAPMS